MDFLPGALVDKTGPTATLLGTRRVAPPAPSKSALRMAPSSMPPPSPPETSSSSAPRFQPLPKLISLAPSDDSSIITATYSLSTPRAGRYTVKLTAKSIRDTLGHFNKPRTLGSFTIKPT